GCVGPASPSIPRCTVPSPPQTSTTSAPFLTARRAALGASRLFGTSYHWGSAKPSRASVSRSSPKPPPKVFAECATTAIDVIVGSLTRAEPAGNRASRVCPLASERNCCLEPPQHLYLLMWPSSDELDSARSRYTFSPWIRFAILTRLAPDARPARSW